MYINRIFINGVTVDKMDLGEMLPGEIYSIIAYKNSRQVCIGIIGDGRIQPTKEAMTYAIKLLKNNIKEVHIYCRLI